MPWPLEPFPFPKSRPIDPIGEGVYDESMTHTNPVLLDREGQPITIGAMVEFDGIGIFGRVKAVYPLLTPPSVAVHWFDRDATEHSNPARLCVVLPGPEAESEAEMRRMACGWLTPCAKPATEATEHPTLGLVYACVTCSKIIG